MTSPECRAFDCLLYFGTFVSEMMTSTSWRKRFLCYVRKTRAHLSLAHCPSVSSPAPPRAPLALSLAPLPTACNLCFSACSFDLMLTFQCSAVTVQLSPLSFDYAMLLPAVTHYTLPLLLSYSYTQVAQFRDFIVHRGCITGLRLRNCWCHEIFCRVITNYCTTTQKPARITASTHKIKLLSKVLRKICIYM